MAGKFESFVFSSPARIPAPNTNRSSVVIPQYRRPIIDPNVKLSAPTGKTTSFAELPENVRTEYQSQIRQADLENKSGGGFAGFVKAVARAFPRAAQAVALDYMRPQGGGQFVPQTSFERFLFGEEPIKSLSRQYTEAEKTLESGGFGQLAPIIAGTAIFGGTIFDLTFSGGSKKKLADQLAKTVTREGVETILRKANISDDFIRIYADDLVKATTKGQIDDILKNMDEAAKAIKPTFNVFRGEGAKQYMRVPGADALGEGFYVSRSKNVAEAFGEVTPYSLKLKPNEILRISSESQKTEILSKAVEETGLTDIQKLLPAYARKHGYRAVEAVGELAKTDPAIGLNIVDDSLVKSLREAAKKAAIRPTKQLVSRAERELAQGLPTSQTARQLQKESLKDFAKVSSYFDDTTKLKTSQTVINLDNLNISGDAKKIIEEEFQGLQERLVQKVGRTLTNQEVRELSENSAKVLRSTASRADTLKWESGLLKLRQRLSASAESGQVTKEFLDDLASVKEIGSDIGRKLQSFSIKADPKLNTAKQFILEEVLSFTDDADAVLRAAQGVDFNDFKQAAAFYRQYIKPSAGEWVDLIRYNSMLSSPLTHIINIFSNLGNTFIRTPLTKLMSGGLDLLSSTATGKARTQFAGEAGAYLSGYLRNMREAFDRFVDVWAGTRSFTHLDLRRQIPLATKGPAKVAETILSPPMKLLEAADQFFTALAEGGELAALRLRQAKGVPVKNVTELAQEGARYSVFRQELFKEGQGTILDAIDVLTSKILSLRSSKNPFVSTVAKFTVPFVSTPMNLFKQGIEYSPIGFLTAIKNTRKTEQFAKAMIGTGIAIGAGTLIASNRMTWAEPRNESERNAWRENGMQSYSVKIGDRWYSYTKLPPFISFPLSIVAAVNDAIKNRKITDGEAELVISSFAKYAEFLADQSYFKSIGDFFDALSGNEFAISKLIGNYPQQLMPYRAMGGWLARLTDGLQRQIDGKANFIERQVQLLFLNVPFLSQKVPARLGPTGEPIEQRDRMINAFSPIRTIRQTPEEAELSQRLDELKRIKSISTQQSQQLKQQAITLEAELSQLPREEANQRANQLKQNNPELYDKLKEVIEEKKLGLTFEEKRMKALGVENGDRAEFILSQLERLETREEKNAYVEELKRKKIISDEVMKQLRVLLKK